MYDCITLKFYISDNFSTHPTSSSACHKSESWYLEKGSRVRRTGPLKMTGSCGMIARPWWRPRTHAGQV